ncbi:hypothetical protein KRZ98_16750 [Sphingobium sp. AS12]|uniref:hypothetical protein n=1 Tax=Sphingobium sp. AS12 TaxID=2849495 RepID=UPI001C31ABBB|nr:hypothetical protein [Sphingobium sp. AS12]MBV2149895.1 hypothetical protein [Sphingobium sp. AS12]
MDIQPCRGIVINAPEFFVDPAFQQWLANGDHKFTWHDGGEIDEWSDVIVLVDPSLNGEGSDSDMPEHIWNRIVEACREHLGRDRACSNHYVARLTNLDL